jgi:hypothetical protein
MDFIYKIYDIARVSHDLAAVLALWIAPLRYLLLARNVSKEIGEKLGLKARVLGLLP